MQKLSTAAAMLAMLGALLPAPPTFAATDNNTDAVSAVWTPRELRFVYMGFTSKFSCDGLADKMRQVLLQLGARQQDLHVYPQPCSSPYGRPDPFSGVTAKMDVLVPASSGAGRGTAASGGASAASASAGNAAQPVSAHWQTVNVDLSRDPVWAAGQCELLEQIKEKVLPQFSTRNVEYHSSCVPHQLEVGGTTLRADVLVADTPAAVPAPAPAAAAPGPATAPPAAAPDGRSPGSNTTAVYVYPRNGQSETQTQNDRRECHEWAVSQSGYDPMRSGPQSSGSPADYRRAMIACLDARGYTAR